MVDMPGLPRWERGYRCHGLWLEGIRIGVVSLGPAGIWDGAYRWAAEDRKSGIAFTEGEAKSLAAGKRAVEAAHGLAARHGRRVAS